MTGDWTFLFMLVLLLIPSFVVIRLIVEVIKWLKRH